MTGKGDRAKKSDESVTKTKGKGAKPQGTAEQKLNQREKAFVRAYLKSFNATKAALAAGYAESVAKVHAWSWVSITSCPPNKLHVREAVENAIKAQYGEEVVDSDWVLKRAKLLANFNIKKFIRLNEKGDAVYDFTGATDDDWYCIEEYTTEQISKMVGDEEIPVDKLKIKTPSKVQALKLVGDHVLVQAFKQQVEVGGTMTSVNMSLEEYKRARREMLDADEC